MDPNEEVENEREEMFNQINSRSPRQKHRMTECFDKLLSARDSNNDLRESENKYRGRTYGGLRHKLLDPNRADHMEELGIS